MLYSHDHQNFVKVRNKEKPRYMGHILDSRRKKSVFRIGKLNAVKKEKIFKLKTENTYVSL